MKKIEGLDKNAILNSEAKRYVTCYNLQENKKEIQNVKFMLAHLLAK